MKKILFLISILSVLVCFGQDTIISSSSFTNKMYSLGTTLQDICTEAKQFYSQNPNENEMSGYSKFLTWENFWEKRMGPDGSFQSTFDILETEMQFLEQNNLCPSNLTGADWVSIGPNKNCDKFSNSTGNMGILVSVAVDPNDQDVVYVGSNTGGCWKTTNFLDEPPNYPIWTNITETSNLPGMGVWDIVIHPTNSSIIYLACSSNKGYGQGILKSIDGGQTWTNIKPVGTTRKDRFKRLIMHPTNSNILFALVTDKVFKTSDAGNSWSQIFDLSAQSSFIAPMFMYDIQLQPNNPDVIFISTSDEEEDILIHQHPGALLFVSTNGGNSFSEIMSLGGNTLATEMALASSSADPNSVYILYKGILKKTSNAGSTWTTLSNSSGVPISKTFVINDNTPAVIYGSGGVKAMKSTNNGYFFMNRQNMHHDDCRRILIVESGQQSNGTEDKIIMCNDGGVDYSFNGMNQWISKNGEGLNNHQFYGFGISHLSDRMAGGMQDNSNFTWMDGEWCQEWHDGDGAEVVFDESDPDIIYTQQWCCGYHGHQRLRKSEFDGTIWSPGPDISPPTTDWSNAGIVRPMEQHNGQLYYGLDNLFKSSTSWINSSTWTQISDFGNPVIGAWMQGRRMMDFAISESDNDVIYVALKQQSWGCQSCTPSEKIAKEKQLFVTTNGGGSNQTSWTDISIPGVKEWNEITDIEVHPENSGTAWVTIGGYNFNSGTSNRVFKTTDYGSSWTDMSDGLKNFPAYEIKYEKGSNGGLYLATEVGVYYTDNDTYDQLGWLCFKENMPTDIVYDLRINYCKQEIIASTF